MCLTNHETTTKPVHVHASSNRSKPMAVLPILMDISDRVFKDIKSLGLQSSCYIYYSVLNGIVCHCLF